MRFSIRAVDQSWYKTHMVFSFLLLTMELRQRLGSGGFAEVFEAVYQGKIMAVKRMKPSTKNPTATREAFRAEARALHLNHPHIIHVLAAEPEMIVMEFIPEASTLQALIEDHLPCRWRTVAQQLSQAISYLHANNILHLDLKPANILINPQEQCKIIDFGCSQPRNQPRHSACLGTIAYRAPELFQGKLPTTKADMYSLAVTLWALKHQQIPYDGKQDAVLIYQVVAFNRRPSPDPEFQMLWHKDPTQRPDAEQLQF